MTYGDYHSRLLDEDWTRQKLKRLNEFYEDVYRPGTKSLEASIMSIYKLGYDIEIKQTKAKTTIKCVRDGKTSGISARHLNQPEEMHDAIFRASFGALFKHLILKEPAQ